MSTPRPVLERLRGSLDTLPERFASKVDRSGDCWVWTGFRNDRGYGQIDGVGAHRVSYLLATGVDPGNLDVLHHCDNPPCVRPTCLFLGTPADNAADKAAKGRGWGPKIIRDEDVEAIRLLWAEGRMTQVEIGQRFGVTGQQVGKIVNGRSRGGGRVLSPWQVAGHRTPAARLSDAQVSEIRRRYATSGVSQRALAAEYGVGQPHISYLVRRIERAGVA